MDRFLKAAFLFSLLAFTVVFSLKFVLSKENSRIEVIGKEESSRSFSIPDFVFGGDLSEASSLKEEVEENEISAYLNLYETFPGEMLILKIENAQDAVVETSLAERINLYPDEKGNLNGLIPVKYDKLPGDYDIKVTSGDFSRSLKVRIEPRDFHRTSIEVSSETAEDTIENQKANAEYHEKVQSLKGQNESKPLWEGKFKKPLEEYRLTSDFGEIRTVNGKESGRHGGIDMAAPIGTPVYAPADGKVIFSDFITLTGNTLMIEHGMGLKTLYYHMDTLDVRAGDPVEEGSLLGKVGTTGFSTGPHLHFAVAVENIYVDPWSFFENDYRSFIEG